MRALALMLLVTAGCHQPVPPAPIIPDLQLSELRHEFDAAQDRPRIVALLSPS